ncbi:unnamed protein product [Orchesella dallaii]|uniref:Uncharacterized protein n=1 Tax=Orchesella dallaii TaxID=48710 RepID=A0ABP1QEK6_9HEXA
MFCPTRVKQFIPLALSLLFILMDISKAKHVKRSKKASYGSSCNSTVKCDIHALLTCVDNVCECLYSDAMLYNHALGTCVSHVNEVCGYLETKRVFINCVPNAFCDHQQGICKCSKGFVEASTGGNCIKQKGYGQQCHSDAECLGDLSLTCFEEICQCHSENYVPHHDSGLSSSSKTKCVSLAGKSCTAKSGCVPKASCISESDNNGALIPSSMFGWLHPGTCQCETGYEMDEHGYCRGQFGAYCDVFQKVPCLNKFQCLNGICQCKYPDDQIYHEDLGHCMSLVGGPCSQRNATEFEVSEEISCEPFLECQNKTETLSMCGCKQGFIENRDRGCDLTFGQICTGPTMNKCDESTGLHCVDGKCDCKDDLKIYNNSVGRCVAKLGSSCKIIHEGEADYGMVKNGCGRSTGEHSHLLGSTLCEENAKCEATRYHLRGLTSHGVCTQIISPVDREQVDTGHLEVDRVTDDDMDEED